MVIWIIGMSGAGKTTLAKEVVAAANQKTRNTIFLDGDEVREIFGNDLGHSIKDRHRNAERICKLGKFLDEQGFNVVCAHLSIFPDTREWNRKNIENYYEVFIDAPITTLISRDSKGLYGKYKKGEITEVVGMDIEFPIPSSADFVIDNDGSRENLLSHVNFVVEKIIGNDD